MCRVSPKAYAPLPGVRGQSPLYQPRRERWGVSEGGADPPSVPRKEGVEGEVAPPGYSSRLPQLCTTCAGTLRPTAGVHLGPSAPIDSVASPRQGLRRITLRPLPSDLHTCEPPAGAPGGYQACLAGSTPQYCPPIWPLKLRAHAILAPSAPTNSNPAQPIDQVW